MKRCDSLRTCWNLCLALELGEGRWKLGFMVGFGGRVLRRQVIARDGKGLLEAIAWAKQRLGLSESARVASLYEAGRDGFWLPRFLGAHGVENLVIDSSSLEVNRRRRRAKTDRIDLDSALERVPRVRILLAPPTSLSLQGSS